MNKREAYIEAINDELREMSLDRLALVYRLITEDLYFVAWIIDKLKKFLH